MISRIKASSETHPFLIPIATEHPEGFSSLSPGCLLWEINQTGKHRNLNKAAKLC